MRPLLSGQGPITIEAESGLGLSTLLHYIATHERTKQRFRRVWYFDDPARVGQLAGIMLGQAPVLAQTDPYEQLALLGPALDDDTLLVIDNLSPDHPLYLACQTLSPFVLLGLETPPEALETDESGRPIIPPDLPGLVKLRAWPAEDALNLLAQTAEVLDQKGIPRQLRPALEELAALVNYHPLGLHVLGSLIVEDDLSVGGLLEQMRALQGSAKLPPGPELALRLSLEGFPAEYRRLLEAFALYSPLGAPAAAIQQLLQFPTPLLLQRGLSLLKRRNLLYADERLPEQYFLPKLLYRQFSPEANHEPGKKSGERARDWVIRFANEHTYQDEALLAGEAQLRHAYQMAGLHKLDDVLSKLNRALSDYLRTYWPARLPLDAPPPRLVGERLKAVQMARQGLDQWEGGESESGRLLLESAIESLKQHGSSYEIAQAIVMLAQVCDEGGDYPRAIELLEAAAKRVYDLNLAEPLSLSRLALAMTYRHQGRYKEALAVLDERPEAEAERARLYRLMGDWEAMIGVLEKSYMSPYERAEHYLRADRYAEALAAIAEDDSPPAHYLRALIYHLQADYEVALMAYERAAAAYAPDDPGAALPKRAIGAIYALQGRLDEAEALLTDTLAALKNSQAGVQVGLSLGLLAAVHWLKGNNRTAVETASQALQKLHGSGLHAEMGLIYQTLGRACWRLERYEDALRAFLNQAEQVQTQTPRDESRIGVAFFHVAEAYRENEQLDRAIANHRRALSHLKPEAEPLAYLMIQSGLQRALAEAGRYAEALEMNQAILNHLDHRPPPDLGHLGYWLCVMVRAYEAVQNYKQAYKPFMRWLNTLAGRADALTDLERPQLAILALSLATRSLMAHGRYAEVIPLAAEALRLADEECNVAPVKWAARRDYAEALVHQGQYEAAYQTLGPILREELKAEIHTYAAVYEAAGQALHHLKDYRRALDHFWVALETQPVGHKQGLIFEQIALAYLDLGEVPNAVENFHEALKFIDRKAHPQIIARILTALAHTLAGVNRFAEAISVYEEALAMLDALPEVSPLHTARVYASLGRSNERQGHLEAASKAYMKALAIIEKHKITAPEDYRQIMLSLARLWVVRGDQRAAIPYFQKARQEAERHSGPVEVGNICRELAEAERDSGQIAQSLQTYQEGLSFLSEQHPTERAALLRSYGQALAQSQQFSEARQAWNEALALTQDLSPLQIALTHHAIGQAFRAQADYAGAAAAFQEAIGVHPKGTPELAASYRERGECLYEAGEDEAAVVALHSALEVEKALPQQANARLVKTLQALAKAEERREQKQAAIGHYHAALVYMDKHFQPELYADTLRILARLYAEKAAWPDCQKALQEALDLELTLSPRQEERLAQTFRLLGDAYLAEGHLEKAANAFKRMASYVNLSKEDTSKLRTAMSDIERYQATLGTAINSLMVLEKSGGEAKDFLFVYALIVRMYYLLSDFEQSRAMMGRLIKYLHGQAENLSIDDERPDYRALAYYREGLLHEMQNDRPQARDYYRRALKDTSDPSMKWLIEQSLGAVG
jgi:tetratricopeptide (TPR) repeat protein